MDYWAEAPESRGQMVLFATKLDGVLAGVLLYGLLTRIRSSRAIEDAWQVRLDFRWLVEGRSIDHTTISDFRKQHPEALKNLFVQIGLVARELGHVKLDQLAFDGTQLRACSWRSGTRKVADLATARADLAARLSARLSARAARRQPAE